MPQNPTTRPAKASAVKRSNAQLIGDIQVIRNQISDMFKAIQKLQQKDASDPIVQKLVTDYNDVVEMQRNLGSAIPLVTYRVDELEAAVGKLMAETVSYAELAGKVDKVAGHIDRFEREANTALGKITDRIDKQGLQIDEIKGRLEGYGLRVDEITEILRAGSIGGRLAFIEQMRANKISDKEIRDTLKILDDGNELQLTDAELFSFFFSSYLSDMALAKKDIGTLKGDVTELKSEVTDLKKDSSTLKTQIKRMEKTTSTSGDPSWGVFVALAVGVLAALYAWLRTDLNNWYVLAIFGAFFYGSWALFDLVKGKSKTTTEEETTESAATTSQQSTTKRMPPTFAFGFIKGQKAQDERRKTTTSTPTTAKAGGPDENNRSSGSGEQKRDERTPGYAAADFQP